MDRSLLRSLLKKNFLKNLWAGNFKKGSYIIGLVLFFPLTCSAVLSVFDSSTYGLTNQLLSVFRESARKMKAMNSGIESLQNILGKGEAFNFSEIESMLKKERLSLLPFSAGGSSYKKDEKNFDFLSYRNLFEKFWVGSFKGKKYISKECQDEILKFRESHFKESIITGLAFVAHQRETLKSASFDLSLILKEAELATNLRSDTTTTNRLLSFIAHELILTRALLIQLLETQNMKDGFNLPIVLEKTSSKKRELV
ncbi:MAG: hypothetical protein JSS34_00285 [Proteobacteria bacterium]|nr:hypothetical protein [Pseudomonadota bacterium]